MLVSVYLYLHCSNVPVGAPIVSFRHIIHAVQWQIFGSGEVLEIDVRMHSVIGNKVLETRSWNVIGRVR